MSQDFLGDRRQALIDQFFHDEEVKKLSNYRLQLAEQKNRDDLRRASCITDDALLDQLVKLGLTADTLAALAMAPLVHVAWADGKVQKQEREAILHAAEAKGVASDAPAALLLGAWLNESREEPRGLFQTWRNYIEALERSLSDEQLARLQTQVVSFAREVATAAGGFLKLGAISAAEEQALAEIQAAFQRKK